MSKSRLKSLKRENYKKMTKKITDKHITQFPLSENNRLTFIYAYSNKRKTREIICVSLEIKILVNWITIIYYDNHHDGILHRHTLIAYNNSADIVDYEGTKKKGSFSKLLNWAKKDIQSNFITYKRKFLNRNKMLLKDIEVEEY